MRKLLSGGQKKLSNAIINWQKTIIVINDRYRLVGISIAGLMIGYILFILYSQRDTVYEINFLDYFPQIIYTFLLYFISVFAQLIVWLRYLSYLKSPSWEDVTIYSSSIIVRNLPGGFWHWVRRTLSYSATTNLSKRQIAIGNFLEHSILFLVGGLILALFSNLLSGVLKIVVSISILFLILVFQCTTFPKNLPLFKMLFELIYWISLYTISWFMGIINLHMMIQVTHPFVSMNEALNIWVLSSMITQLAFFLPSKFGLREITLTLLLSKYLSIHLAIALALLIRILFLVADLLWGYSGWIFSKRIMRRNLEF